MWLNAGQPVRGAIGVTAILLMATAVVRAQVAAPPHSGMAPHLFIDQSLIHYREGVDLVVHPARKQTAGPVLWSLMPWEARGLSMGGSVIREPGDGPLRMWYTAHAEMDRICHAVSSDGLDWRRSPLGPPQFASHGEGRSIVLERARFPGVLRDEGAAEPARRYKMICRPEHPPGHCLTFTSSDGLRWEPAGVLNVPGTGPLSVTGGTGEGFVAMASAGDRLYRLSSPDFATWTVPEAMDLSGAPAGIGLWRIGRALLGLPYWAGVPGRVDLLTGGPTLWRDPGLDRSPWAPEAGDGWDAALLGLAGAPVRCGGNLLWYYSAATSTGSRGAIGVVGWREEGLISAQGGHRPGALVTTSLVVAGDRLEINAFAPGGVRVQVENDRGQALAGLSSQDCVPFSGDSLCHPVEWEAGGDLSSLRGHSVRLRFTLYEADLFSFRFARAEGVPGPR